MSPRSLLFSGLNPTLLSLSSQERCSSLLITSVAPSGPSPTGPCPFCAGGSRAGHHTPGGVSPELSRGAESPHLDLLAKLLLMQHSIWLAFWAVSTHCWVMFSFSSTNTCKSFSSELLSLHSLPSLYSCRGLPQPRCRTLHLALLNFVRFT